jgi:hypothetical protein
MPDVMRRIVLKRRSSKRIDVGAVSAYFVYAAALGKTAYSIENEEEA